MSAVSVLLPKTWSVSGYSPNNVTLEEWKSASGVRGASIVKPDVVFYHYPCPDGMACRLLIEDYFGEESKTIDFRGWEHGEAQNLSGLEKKIVWFCDVTPPAAILLSGSCLVASEIKIFDHHANDANKALLKQIYNTEYQSSSFKNVSSMTLELTDRCGAMVVFDHLDLMSKLREIPYWLDQINRGDTGLNTQRTEDEKAYHAWITRPEILPDNGDTKAFRGALFSEPIATITKKGYALLAHRQTVCDQQMTKLQFGSFQFTSKETKKEDTYVGVYAEVEGPHMIFMMTETIVKNRHRLLYFDAIGIRWTKRGKKQLSLRRVNMLDLSAVSACRGGGGHAAASGIQGTWSL